MSQDHPNPRRRPKTKPEVSLTRSSAAEYLTFVAASGEGGVEAVYADENVWLSQKMMGLLYDVETHTINYHLKKIFSDQELQENSVIRNFRITAADGKPYDTLHYNLAAIISVGRAKLDRSTENLLAFNASGAKSVPDSATGAAQGDAKSDDKPWWKVW